MTRSDAVGSSVDGVGPSSDGGRGGRSRRGVLAALAVLALIALAGCQAPGTPDSTEFAPQVPVVNGTGADMGTTIELSDDGSVDPGRVFVEVEQLLESDVEPPPNVRVLTDIDNFGVNVSTPEAPVREYLNVTRRGSLDLGDQENGAVSAIGVITIYPGQSPDRESTTWVLAHELVHYVQVRQGVDDRLRERIGVATTDGRFTQRAMLEGPAVYTTEAYLDEYTDTANSTLELYRSIDEGLPPGSSGVYSNRQYLLGYSYVKERADSPATLGALYNDTALTSEHLIHGYAPGEEPMADLSVTYDGGDDWTAGDRDRMGEAFVWSALEDRLGTDRAREAAAGWGNDTMLTVHPTDDESEDGEPSVAWVLRWDDAANASEFATAAERYLERAGESDGGPTELDSGVHAALERTGDRTAVLLLGEREFVTETTVEGGDGQVTVETDG